MTAEYKKEGDIPVTLLRQLISYDPASGQLIWLPRPIELFRGVNVARACATWNTRFSGKPAFTAETTHGYLRGAIFGIHLKAHRVAWALHHGFWPDGTIDHIDGETSDNRLTNLRCVSHAENGKNQKLRSTNTSGTMGVNFDPRRARWVASIYKDGKKKYLGEFSEKCAAVNARLSAQQNVGYHTNHGRTTNV